jgi:hypothetical protein
MKKLLLITIVVLTSLMLSSSSSAVVYGWPEREVKIGRAVHYLVEDCAYSGCAYVEMELSYDSWSFGAQIAYMTLKARLPFSGDPYTVLLELEVSPGRYFEHYYNPFVWVTGGDLPGRPATVTTSSENYFNAKIYLYDAYVPLQYQAPGPLYPEDGMQSQAYPAPIEEFQLFEQVYPEPEYDK